MSQVEARHTSPLRSITSAITNNDSAKIREKLAHRRSILNHMSDGKIRRTKEFANNDGTNSNSAATTKPAYDPNDEDRENMKNENDHRINNDVRLKQNTDDSGDSTNLLLSPHLMTHLQSLKEEGGYISISKKKQKKDAAEIRLKGLFLKSISGSKSEDGSVGVKSFFSSSTSYVSSLSSVPSDDASDRKATSVGRSLAIQQLFKSPEEENAIDCDNEEKSNGHYNAEKNHHKHSIKQTITLQDNIKVYDNFIVVSL